MNKWVPITALLVLSSGAAGWWYSKPPTSPDDVPIAEVSYTCAMHPQVHQSHAGPCPICGMKLIARHASAQAADRSVVGDDAQRPLAMVRIDPRMAQNLGMRTALVAWDSTTPGIDAPGSIAVDERRLITIEARTAGWIERLDVHAVGDAVRRGQSLAAVYSPELLAGQQELALAQKIGDPQMVEAARTRLQLLGASASSNLLQHRVNISAPQSGVVTDLMVRQGAEVGPGMPLMKIADLSSVWMIVEIPEAQALALHEGDTAQARFPGTGARVFPGSIDYLYPTVDAQTRTLRARLVFDNLDGALKPGMYGRVQLGGPAAGTTLSVPSEAVIRTGRRNIVIVAESEGEYRPVEVVLGAEHNERIEVESGLTAGQRIVTSGQFLIDSEASLQGVYERLGAGP